MHVLIGLGCEWVAGKYPLLKLALIVYSIKLQDMVNGGTRFN